MTTSKLAGFSIGAQMSKAGYERLVYSLQLRAACVSPLTSAARSRSGPNDVMWSPMASFMTIALPVPEWLVVCR